MNYFLKIGILVSLYYPTFLKAQVPKHYKVWSDTVILEWEDFKGKAKLSNSDGFSAVSVVGIYKNLELSGNLVEINTVSYFDKNRSWENKNNRRTNGIIHEQTHFDIGELYARKFRREILSIKNRKDYRKISHKIEKMYKSTFQNYSEFQDQYDEETEHSLNEQKQEEWNNRIANELVELREYSNPIITIELKKE